MIGSVVLACVVLFALRRCVVVVPAGCVALVERLGRRHRTLQPGAHWIWWGAEWLRAVDWHCDGLRVRTEMVPTEQQQIDFPPFRALTRDRIEVIADGVLYVRVVDAARAAYTTSNVLGVAENAVRAAMREALGRLDSAAVIEHAGQIATAVRRAFDTAVADLGVEMCGFELESVLPADPEIIALRGGIVKADLEAQAMRIRTDAEHAAALRAAESVARLKRIRLAAWQEREAAETAALERRIAVEAGRDAQGLAALARVGGASAALVEHWARVESTRALARGGATVVVPDSSVNHIRIKAAAQ